MTKSRGIRNRSIKTRLLEKTKLNELTGCLEWQGASVGLGYGAIRPGNGVRKNILVHRAAYEIFKGPIPDGMHVCHSCDNRKCVNPEHLWLGTASDNMQDCSRKKRFFNNHKNHCKKGHVYSGDNLRIHKNGARICRTCTNLNKKKSYILRRTSRIGT